MNLQKRIRASAANKVLVVITNRTRAKNGFVVENPDGRETFHPTKREALSAMLAQVRCADVKRWSLRVECLALLLCLTGCEIPAPATPCGKFAVLWLGLSLAAMLPVLSLCIVCSKPAPKPPTFPSKLKKL